jgi:hypothetical protein
MQELGGATFQQRMYGRWLWLFTFSSVNEATYLAWISVVGRRRGRKEARLARGGQNWTKPIYTDHSVDGHIGR